MAEVRTDIRAALDRVAFAESLGVDPDPWQRELLASHAHRILMNCCRQSGKSTMAAVIALHRALFSPRSLVLILAPAERQAKETFSKITGFYRILGHSVDGESHRKLGMELSNGSRIEALPGTEKTIRGFSGVDLLILDEASRVTDELYYAVRPMLAVSASRGSGALIMLSTPWGQQGVFYEAWARRFEQGWDYYEVPASEVPRISPEFLEEERASLTDWHYQQEYNVKFMEREDAVFSEAIIGRIQDDDVPVLDLD